MAEMKSAVPGQWQTVRGHDRLRRRREGKTPRDASIQPDWKGVCTVADTIGKARAVAGKDCVVLMADMFGKGYGDKEKNRDELRVWHDERCVKEVPFTLA